LLLNLVTWSDDLPIDKLDQCLEKLPTTGLLCTGQPMSLQHPTPEALEANIDYMDASYNVAGHGHADFHRKFGPAACP